jgi:N-methylhydantoinase A
MSAVADEKSAIEFESWHARARCQLARAGPQRVSVVGRDSGLKVREIYLPRHGATLAELWRLEEIPDDRIFSGPAIVETAATTVLIDPGATFSRRASGTLHISPAARRATEAIATSVRRDG